MSFERAMVSRILTRLGLGGGVSAAHVASEHLAYRERKTKTKGPKLDMKEFLRQQGTTTVMSPLTRQKVKITSLTGGKYRDDPKSQELLKKMFQAWKGKVKPEAEPDSAELEPSEDEDVPEEGEDTPPQEEPGDADEAREQEPPEGEGPAPDEAESKPADGKKKSPPAQQEEPSGEPSEDEEPVLPVPEPRPVKGVPPPPDGGGPAGEPPPEKKSKPKPPPPLRPPPPPDASQFQKDTYEKSKRENAEATEKYKKDKEEWDKENPVTPETPATPPAGKPPEGDGVPAEKPPAPAESEDTPEPGSAEPTAPPAGDKAEPAPAEGGVVPPEPGLSRAPEVPEGIRDLANPAEGAESTVVNKVIKDGVAGKPISQKDAWEALKQTRRALGRGVDANGKPTISAEDLKKLQDTEEWLRSVAGMELKEPEMDLDKGKGQKEEKELSEEAKAVVTKHGLTPEHVERAKKFVKKQEEAAAKEIADSPSEKIRLKWGLPTGDVNTARRSMNSAVTHLKREQRQYKSDLKKYEKDRPKLEDQYTKDVEEHPSRVDEYNKSLPAAKEAYAERVTKYEASKKEYDEGVARGEEGLFEPTKPYPLPSPPAPPKKPEPPKEPSGVDFAEVRRDIEDEDPGVASALSEIPDEDLHVLLKPKAKSKSVAEVKKQYIDSLTDPDEKKRIMDMDPDDFEELLSALGTSKRGRGKWGTLREQVVRVAYLHPKLKGRLLSALSPHYGGWV